MSFPQTSTVQNFVRLIFLFCGIPFGLLRENPIYCSFLTQKRDLVEVGLSRNGNSASVLFQGEQYKKGNFFKSKFQGRVWQGSEKLVNLRKSFPTGLMYET